MLVAWGFSLLYGLLVLLTSCEQCRAGLGGATNDLDKVIEDLARTIADSQVLGIDLKMRGFCLL